MFVYIKKVFIFMNVCTIIGNYIHVKIAYNLKFHDSWREYTHMSIIQKEQP